MELAGKVIAVLEPRGGVSKTGNEWKVQEYVIETHDQYPKKIDELKNLYGLPESAYRFLI